MKELLLIGGGGHCLSCIAAIETASHSFRIRGIVDNQLAVGTKLAGYPVLGDDGQLPALLADGRGALIAVGYVEQATVRERIAENIVALQIAGFEFPVVVAGNASVSHANIGEGTIVMQMAIMNAGASIGRHCIINNRALVEHGASVGDFSHVATGAIVNGDCELGQRVFIGSGAVLKHGVRLADDVRIGAGSVVVKHLDAPGWYVGNPARPVHLD